MKKIITPLLVTYLCLATFALTGCAASTEASTATVADTDAQPAATANTDPKKGWVDLDPAPMPFGSVYVSVRCKGTTLMFITQDDYTGSASIATVPGASECVG
jgi:hypothetical protein